jgi:hypothetical protein
MDTTSHNFTWETYTFGGAHGSSYLKDVAIINENNIWAVGEIHTEETDQFDSNGVWVKPYNAVHWDGNNWELKRILFPVDADKPNSYKSAKGCGAIFVFNENDFVITANTQFAFMNSKGEYFIKTIGFKWEDRFTINSLWGTSSKDFYVVGNRGNIVHYNGNKWTKIESGTDLDIKDIWGDYNDKTGKWEILCVASDYLRNTGRSLLKIENNRITNIDIEPINGRLQSLWFKTNKKYFLVGSGVYTKNKLQENKWRKLPNDEVSVFFQESISAIDINDMIVTGHYSEVIHFNGINWKSYRGEEIPFTNGQLFGSYYKNNIVAVVGSNGREGLLYIGKK